MALSDFKTEDKSNSYHDNRKLDKKKLHKDNICSSCGKEARNVRGSEWKCTTPRDECEVITYRVPTS